MRNEIAQERTKQEEIRNVKKGSGSRPFPWFFFAGIFFLAVTVKAGSCSDPNFNAAGDYSVGGYFVLGDYNDCDWQTVLEQIHQVGADTVIQFGGSIRPSTLSLITADNVFKQCTDCVTKAMEDVAAMPGNHQIVKIFTYASNTVAGDHLLASPPLEQKIDLGGDYIFWRLLFPEGNERTPAKDVGPGVNFDLVLVSARRYDSLQSLLRKADVFGKKVYMGMPTYPQHPQYPWKPDENLFAVAGAITERFFTDLSERFSTYSSWVGLYQSFEISVTRNPTAETINLYNNEHGIAKTVLRDKKILVSPYWSSRLSESNFASPTDITEGIKKIAEAGVDIVAPQDGGGTGKVGRYVDAEKDTIVESRLQKVLGGSKTYAAAYGSSTADFFGAGKTGINQASSATGRIISYWANIEAFNPDPPATGEACGTQTRSRTEKVSLDKGIQLATPTVDKVISFMWTPYYTCLGGKPESLSTEIKRAVDKIVPTVNIISPVDRKTYTTTQTVTLTAIATDNVEISHVQFFLDGAIYRTVTGSPYEVSWTIPMDGTGDHTWMAKAFDEANNETDSPLVTLRIALDRQAPSSPFGLTAVGNIKAMSLSWEASTDEGGSGLKGYLVDISTEVNFGSYLPGWENKFFGLVTSTDVSGLSPDTVYYARLRAQDNMDNVSPYSLIVSTRTSILNADVPLTSGWLVKRGSLTKEGDTWTYAETTEFGAHYSYKTIATGLSTSEYLQFSVSVKPSITPARNISLQIYNDSTPSNRATANCTLSDEGTVSLISGGEAKGVSGAVVAQGNGWYLCQISAKLDSRNGSRVTFVIWGLSGLSSSYTGDPLAGFQFKNPEVISQPEDTQPPTITISSPDASTTFTIPQTVRLTATGTDNIGITSVSFILNGTTVFTTTSAPYIYNWPIASTNNGDYFWTATAFDAMGNSSTSAAVPVTVAIDTTTPSISMTAPAANSTFTTPQTVTVTATASDNVAVSKVWFILDTVVVSTGTSSPYAYDWPITGENNGLHRWSATAFDAMGNSSTTVTVPVTVNVDVMAPTIPASLTAMASSSTSIHLAWAAATDNVGVVGYHVHRGTVSVATVTGDVLTFTDTGLLPKTHYPYTVSAFDALGNESPPSEEKSAVTLQLPLAIPLARVNGITSRSADVRWTAVPNATRYTVAASLSRDGGPFVFQQESVEESYLLSGLSPNTTYYLLMNACDETYCTDYALVNHIVTQANVPDLTVESVGEREVHLRIDPKGNPAGTVYQVEVSQGNEPFALKSVGTTLTPVITDLNPREPYRFRAFAQNFEGVRTPMSEDKEVALPQLSVEGARAYPTPFRLGLGVAGMTFDRMPAETPVRIYTIDGRLARRLTTGADGRVVWDLMNDEGRPVISGVYEVLIEKNGAKKKLKVVIQR